MSVEFSHRMIILGCTKWKVRLAWPLRQAPAAPAHLMTRRRVAQEKRTAMNRSPNQRNSVEENPVCTLLGRALPKHHRQTVGLKTLPSPLLLSCLLTILLSDTHIFEPVCSDAEEP